VNNFQKPIGFIAVLLVLFGIFWYYFIDDVPSSGYLSSQTWTTKVYISNTRLIFNPAYTANPGSPMLTNITEIRKVIAQGKNLDPAWPKYTLDENISEELDSKEIDYSIEFKDVTNQILRYRFLNELEWRSYKIGKNYSYNTNRTGMITSKPIFLKE
jgi:hypothetical protein